MNGEDVTEAIRAPEVSAAASRVSVHRSVREAMVDRQRELIAAGDYVAEGRDIGTVVSPDAPLKVFLTASDSERARRRAAETDEPLERVRAALASRDDRDRRREHGALRRAADSTEVDTTGLDVEQVVERIVAMARAARPGEPMSDRRAPGRRRRLPERRQVDARQPAGRGPRGRGPSEAGVTRDRKALDCEWNGLAFRLIDTGGVDLAAEDSLAQAVQRQAREAIADRRPGRCWWSTPARGCAPATPSSPTSCAALGRPSVVVANKIDEPGDAYLAAEFHAPRARGSPARLRRPRPRHRRPPRPDHGPSRSWHGQGPARQRWSGRS